VVADAALERLALTLQQQLQRIGVDLRCSLMSLDDAVGRVRRGDFDVFLADFQMGPTLLQPYRTWATGAPRNMGGYSSPKVDAAFDQINASANEDEYRSGVAALQRAIYDDPPAIFIAWSERARAVSTRFDVPIEPGRDILGTLRQWKPVPEPALASQN
jgi:ABC-type transport system substrate-binding protein